MQPLAPYIQRAYRDESVYIPPLVKDQIFGAPENAPQLVQARTNRIIVYPGSFNPPHRGHLHLLNHTYYHGVPDLNVIAAIVLPSSDESLSGKCGRKGTTFRFGREERCKLWKEDPHFPEWAWVFESTEDGARNGISEVFRKFVHNLTAATSKDGYKIDFVYLYGPDRMTPKSSWEICRLTLLCDAARPADYQRSCGRLRNFQNFTSWKRAETDEKELEILQRAKVQLALAALGTTRPDVAQKAIEECPDYVDKITQARVAAALRDLRDVVCCKDSIQGTRTLRFIKYKGDGLIRAKSVAADKGTVLTKNSIRRKEINSTKLRDAMRTKNGTDLRGFLNRNALSPEVLWWYAPMWLKRAKNGCGNGITFLSPPSSKTDPENAVILESSVVVTNSRKRRLSVAFPEEDTTPAPSATRIKRAASI